MMIGGVGVEFYVFGILGALVHIVKRQARGQTDSAIEKYFRDNTIWTLITFTLALALIYGEGKAGQLNTASALTTGYAANSLFGSEPD